MTDALRRILGLKAKMGLNKKPKEELTPQPEAMSLVGDPKYTEFAAKVAQDAITLVKYKDEGVLPITPEKYKKVMIVYVKGAETGMTQLMKFAFGAGAAKNPARCCARC